MRAKNSISERGICALQSNIEDILKLEDTQKMLPNEAVVGDRRLDRACNCLP